MQNPHSSQSTDLTIEVPTLDLAEVVIQTRTALTDMVEAIEAVAPAALAAAANVRFALAAGASTRDLVVKGSPFTGSANAITRWDLVASLYELDGSDEVEQEHGDVPLPLAIHRLLGTAANDGLGVPAVRSIISEHDHFDEAYTALVKAAKDARAAKRAAEQPVAEAEGDGEGGEADGPEGVEDGALALLTTALAHVEQALSMGDLSVAAEAVLARIQQAIEG